jgi:hypothetical protein
MSFPTITVYSKSNNLNTLRVLDKGTPVVLDDVTKIELRLDTGEVLSSDDYPTQITWSTGVEPAGLIYLRLGELPFITKIYTAELMIFDAVNTLGLFFGYFRMRGIEEKING